MYSVLLARWRSELPPSAELFVQVGAANVILLPAFLLVREPGVARSAIPLILYAAAAGSVAAPLLWMKGVARVGPARAATFFNLLPVITAALAIAVLGEALTVALVSGGLLAIAGVALAERAARV
jgi:drug/metabolite transporter (DMT)-like permease